MSSTPPVQTSGDVAAVWSEDLTAPAIAPVRDALIAGETAMLLAYQDASAYAAAQSDRLRATDEYQDEILGEEFGIPRQPSETNDAYNARANRAQPVVSPNDICASVNALLAPFTTVRCVYYEPSDGVFASNPATCSWSNHAFAATEAGPFATPNYPDRRYAKIANRRPKGHCVFSPGGRLFVLRVPDVSPVDTTVAAAFQMATNIVMSQTASSFVQPAVNSAVSVPVRDLSKFAVGQFVNAQGLSGGLPAFVGTYEVTAVGASPCTIALTLQSNGAAFAPGSTVPAGTTLEFDQPPEQTAGNAGSFPGATADGNAGQAAVFAWSADQSVDDLYASIISVVEGMRGTVRWSLIVDKYLT